MNAIKHDNTVYIASYGAGVNSTAMILLLLKEKRPIDKILFADTGCEYPETYQYMRIFDSYLSEKHGMKIETVAADSTLLEYCERHHILPSFRMRFCTSKFKIQPMRKAMKEAEDGKGKFIVYLGVDAGEDHRARQSPYPDTTNVFPLIEADLDREACICLIKSAGLPEPRKSGCWMCPFQGKRQVAELAENHPNLILKIEKLEEDVNKAWSEREKPFYLFDKPVREKVKDSKELVRVKQLQLELFDEEELKRPCLCAFS